jgi:hypothetical protein
VAPKRASKRPPRRQYLRLQCRHVASGIRGVDQVVAIPQVGPDGAKADLCAQCAVLFWE